MSSVTFTEVRTYNRWTCIACAVDILLTADQETHLRNTHRDFHCLNGHPQRFTGKSEAERLREQLHAKTLEHERAERQRKEAEEREAKLALRVSHGTCPCCNRTFKQLAAHMQRKHPGYGVKKK